ncbi:MAG: zinc ribbon domain-containing protein [Treponema sp.]|nr:zinc ribbon domain-containing protein [Treponema sp.]
MKNKGKLKKAKFFCENCGNEVRSKDKVCTHCGKFFSSVKCPSCGKIGNTEEFVNGCPDCGYAVSSSNKMSNIQQMDSKSRKSRFFNSYLGRLFVRYQTFSNSTSLPIWIYAFCILLLIFVIVCFYSCLIK